MSESISKQPVNTISHSLDENTKQQRLIEINIDALNEGLALLELLNLEQYQQGYKPVFQSTLGTHYRHVLEHYRCFFSQLPTFKFRYDKRERDQKLEVNIDYAKQTIKEIVQQFVGFDMTLFAKMYTVAEEQKDMYLIDSVETNLGRELMFLQSHTVHHFAMIAAMSRGQGISPDESFGVAIPTQNYTRSLDMNASFESK